MPFDVGRVIAEAKRYAERIYTIFRWAVTDEFLVRYAGKPSGAPSCVIRADSGSEEL